VACVAVRGVPRHVILHGPAFGPPLPLNTAWHFDGVDSRDVEPYYNMEGLKAASSAPCERG